MIFITQNSDTEATKKYCEKSGIIKINIDKKLQEWARKNIEVTDTNMKYITNYMKKFNKYVKDDGKFEFCWVCEKDQLRSYPIQMVNMEDYLVNPAYWVNIGINEKMYNIEISNIKNIISFEYIYREIGYSLSDIENKLRDLGIAGFNSSSKLIDRIENLKSMYSIGKNKRVVDTPYKSLKKDHIMSYLGNEYSTKGKTYQEIIEISCKEIISLIASNLALNVDKKLNSIKIISIGIDGFTIMCDSDINIYDYIETIVIRSFGRQFLLETRVEEF